jgi:hypothetical protein
MAYETGSVASPTALQTIIENFCTTNGWTLNAGAGSWLSKGQSHVHFSGANTTTLTISGANSADGTTELCPFTRSIYIPSVSWPVTYHLFYDTAPDQVSCVLNYESTKIQVIMFGDLVKVHNSAYVGGNWFFASRGGIITDNVKLSACSDIAIQSQTTIGGAVSIPFSLLLTESGGSHEDNNGGLHCKIDGNIWYQDNDYYNYKVSLTDYTISALFRSPNSWNNQAQLIPIHLQYTMASALYSYIGYVEHLRFIRVDNYEIGDIITLGSDKWKVFPWYIKNVVSRNGNSVSADSGTLGFACRYTP